MKRYTLTLAFLLFAISRPAISQATTSVSEMPYAGAPCTDVGGVKPSKQQVELFNRFDTTLRAALKRNDVAALAFLMNFPLRVNTSKGTLLIPDAESLDGHYAEIFPQKVREDIFSTAPADYICRYDMGVAYKAGVIWTSTNDLKFAINTVNEPGTQKKSDKPAIVYTCETKTHRISIEDLNNNKYRYRSWNKPKDLSAPADVDISTGTLHFEGTGICAYGTYSFTRGNVEYSVSQGLGCTDGSEPLKATGKLRVIIGDKEVTDAWCF